MKDNIESIKMSGRERLKSIESEGKYIFHGSGEGDINVLIPRQAYNYSSNHEKHPDGSPAVFATPVSDIAIFMAIFSNNNFSNGLRSGYDVIGKEEDEELKFNTTFRISKHTQDQLSNQKGYVYVFPKDKFNPREEGSAEWISYEPVVPTEIIEVQKDDLPNNIEVTEF